MCSKSRSASRARHPHVHWRQNRRGPESWAWICLCLPLLQPLQNMTLRPSLCCNFLLSFPFSQALAGLKMSFPTLITASSESGREGSPGAQVAHPSPTVLLPAAPLAPRGVPWRGGQFTCQVPRAQVQETIPGPGLPEKHRLSVPKQRQCWPPGSCRFRNLDSTFAFPPAKAWNPICLSFSWTALESAILVVVLNYVRRFANTILNR